MYSGKSSEFVASGFFSILPLSYSLFSMACVLLVLNSMSWCFILQLSGNLVNYIVLFFQLTSGLCLTNQSCPRNMSILFKSITAAFNCSLYLLILTSRGATLVTSPFFVPFALKTSNEKLIGLVWILLSLTNCLLIPMCVHPESTNVLTLRFFLFFVLTFACTFNSFSALLCQLEIIYLSWEFTEISHTVPTQDLHQNPSSGYFLYFLHHLIFLEPFVSLLTAFFYSPLQCVLLCHTWNIFWFLFLSFCSNIFGPYSCTCCSWSTLASHLWNYCWIC